MKNPDFSRVLFLFSCVLTIFALGVAVGRYRLFPYSALEFAKLSFEQVLRETEMFAGRPTAFLMASPYHGHDVTRFRTDQTAPGMTLISGFFNGGNEIRLIRSDGSIVHRWPVRLFDIFPNLAHVRPQTMVPNTNWNAEIHGALALPDGSVVFNFDHLGMVKLSRCGTVEWTVPRMTHHSVELSEDGGFWVPARRYVENGSQFPALTPPYLEDTILKVSADGKVVTEISVPGLLFKNNLQALLFANGLPGIQLAKESEYEISQIPDDITHLNDVEELSSAMADRFPQFSRGDLLISMRDLNLVMVVDPRTEKVKWHQTGPWIKQHDPDFEAGGRISIFNNNADGTETGTILGGSNIIEVDPVNGETTFKYGAAPGQRMFSDTRGKHQNLENGDILITETEAGRVIEVNDKGDIVWEFINRYNVDEVAFVTQAVRYPEDYFMVKDWTCH